MSKDQHYYDEEAARKQGQLAASADMVAQRRNMLEILDPQPGETVLDVGCGNGFFARDMAGSVGRSGNVHGIDGSSAIIEMARNACPAGEFRTGDATDLPYGEEMFDVVTASQVLCFIANMEPAVREMYRVLKPGGRIVILDTDWQSIVWNCSDRALMQRALALMTSDYENAHVPRTLSVHLKAAGFEVTSRTTHTILNWDRDPDRYAQHIVASLEKLAGKSDAFSDSDWAAWQADQAATEAAGVFMFSLNRYLFSATKP